jgi:CxxC motif-containing protein (DUF1111 family)
MKATTLFRVAALPLIAVWATQAYSQPPNATATEAKSGFNTIAISSPSTDPNNPANAAHLDALSTFEEVEQASPNGLGPIYNAQSCRECHQNPVSGGASQVTEHRAGHRVHGVFHTPVVEIEGDKIVNRSLINDRAICAEAQERVPEIDVIETNRLSLSVLGDGFIEAIEDQTILDFRKQQCDVSSQVPGVCGFAIYVPILETAGKSQRIGRFGWKDQHASLMSFAADAYVNEMGITNLLIPDEFTLVCNPKVHQGPGDPAKGEVTEPNDLRDPKTHKTDLDQFASFMRETAVPPRDAATMGSPAVTHGEALFKTLGCSVCHVPTMKTAPAGTMLNGGTYAVSEALGNKIIHPYSDFLLHDVGTGDGIVIAAPEHYGATVAAYMEKVDDEKLSTDEADALGLKKGQPKTREYLLNKGNYKLESIETSAFFKPFYERSFCDSASESEKVLENKSKAFSIGRQCSANKIRTPPLWGVRVRTRLMHDGGSLRFEDAIERHKGEAQTVTLAFQRLSKGEKDQLIQFLKSL